MPCVYTQWVDAHCCLPLNTFCNLPDFNRSEENVENVFLNYDRPSHGFYLASDSSPAIHSKTTAKVRKRIGFTKFWVFFLAYLIYFSYLCHQINNNNIKKEVIMQAIKNNTKEENIRKFKQLLKHKEEMLERAKQYDGIDIYAKTEIHY
ncbi:hypothetical protein PREVCOP_04180 [Segatella copri DSM 18205]|uniref:Uncharacterized protein n=1 Tax=Segatella copri DSM 18205 TaxID=537011 RepID=D1PAF5_9BACT|nr:hypothetical protein PREVCOP_04180 [Segatella copri DSM 18205]